MELPETHTWEGMVCSSCLAGFESSPTNAVSVIDFNYCPECGSSTLSMKAVEKPMVTPIDEYLHKQL